jgi:hypothetical protein
MTIDVEITSTVPSLDDAVQAACMPIEVADDLGLFIRSGTDSAPDEGYEIDIPPGKYDMLVRIYATEGKDDDEDDDDFNPHCKASLTFLPRGTIGPKCFKRKGYAPPSKLVIHTADGGTEEFPI